MALVPIGFSAAIVLMVVGLVTLVRRRGDRTGLPAHPRAATIARWRWGGVVAGVVLAAAMISVGDLGRGPLLASVAFGAGVLAGVLGGELSVRPVHAQSRAAVLEPRSLRSYLPVGLGLVVSGATVVLGALMIVTAAAGAPDDQGRAGRALSYSPDPTRAASYGPWPGSYYSAPVAVALLVAAVVTALVLRQVTLRPRDGDTVSDDALRRTSAEAVTAAWGVAVGVPLAGFAMTALVGLTGIDLAPTSWRIVGWLLLVLVVGALVLVLWSLTTLVVPRRVARQAVPLAASHASTRS